MSPMEKLATLPPPPQWVTSDATPVQGLDLLGLRVPVERIGLTLLAAVTTISPTLRYIGLRAWIARQYALAKLPDDWDSLLPYAAKVEAAIAIGNLLHNSKAGGLVGFDDATGKIAADDGDVTLEALVQQLATRIYTGPSNALQISWSRDPGIPGLSAERGVPLADAVEEGLSTTKFVREFRADPSRAGYSREVLRELGAAFPVLQPSAAERKVLIEALFPAGPIEALGAFSTYRLMLELAQLHQRKPNAEDVFYAAVTPPVELAIPYKPCLDGWLWYLSRDVLAVSHEAVMKAIVEELRNSREPRNASELLTSLVSCDSELEHQLHSFSLLPEGDRPLDRPLSELAELVRNATSQRTGDPARWDGVLQETAIIRSALASGVAALAVLPVSWLLVRERLASATSIPDEHRMLLSYQGTDRIGAADVVEPVLTRMLSTGRTIREACFELASRTVNQHLQVAWSRLQQDPRKDVALLQADGASWSSDRSFGGGRVASRLREAVGWLSQLGLVDENGCTASGKALMNSLRLTRAAGGSIS